MKYAILIVGYNRLEGIKRLVGSLMQADYLGDSVDLIFSIDHSDTDEVYNYASEFCWSYGEKRVRTFEQRQGLKKHILSCGDFLAEYDAIAVFEDDVYVSSSFYSFMREAVPFYMNDGNIAGISLYSFRFNLNCKWPFEPARGKSDVYFMNQAQSWGQIWLKKQWFEFKSWLETFDNVYDERTSDFINSWPKESSWLKLHIKYCVDNDKFFVYPYNSLTTCFSDAGEHTDVKQNLQQVPILQGKTVCDFKFEHLSNDAIIYDCYFERILNSDILVDLNGLKEKLYSKSKFILTSNKLDYKLIKSFGLELKPIELNYLLEVPGDDIYLYDTCEGTGKIINRRNDIKTFFYYYTISGKFKLLLKICVNKLKNKTFRKK